MKTKHTFFSILLLMVSFSLMAQPQGVNYEANSIVLNGDDWSELIQKLNEKSDSNKFTIVHIGDSHVQPGIMTGVVRRSLQAKYGNGGRGLVCPLTLAKSHGPSDVVLKSSSTVSASSRLLTKAKPAGMGVTGVAVKFAGGRTTLKLQVKHEGDEFNQITLLHSPDEPFAVTRGTTLIEAAEVSPTATEFSLSGLQDTVSLRLKGNGALYGLRLLNNKPGVVVECIGNDGATYSSYVRINGFSKQLKDFNPQLVIISLGTNEAYGNITALESNLDKLVQSIRQENPDVKILLTTPLETHKKAGGSYVVQSGIASVRNVIMSYGKAHHIAVWDFYTVGGGQGAASRWLNAKYMNTDHLHLVSKGYNFMGELLSNALLKVFTVNNP